MKNWVEQINITITDYLGQMASWMDDCKYCDSEWEHMDFKSFAKILYMGKIYE